MFLDLQGRHHRAAPLGLGMAADFDREVGRPADVKHIVRRVHFVQRARQLEQAPGLDQRGCCRRCQENERRHRRLGQYPAPKPSWT